MISLDNGQGRRREGEIEACLIHVIITRRRREGRSDLVGKEKQGRVKVIRFRDSSEGVREGRVLRGM